jgi:hypothetical protein
MSNERPTKEVTLSSGTVVVLYEYITGGDKRAIEDVFLSEAELKQTASKGGPNQMEITGVKGNVTHQAENKAFERVIKEMRTAGGEVITDRAKVLSFLLDLPVDEYDVVVAEVNAITEPKKAPATS